MKYIVTLNGKSYEVEVEKGQATIMSTTEVAVAAMPKEEVAAPVAKQAVHKSGVGEELKAPMPGTILETKVKEGSVVKKGEVLFILEAMKMENEIMAPKDGVISELVAVKGKAVVTGEILAVIA